MATTTGAGAGLVADPKTWTGVTTWTIHIVDPEEQLRKDAYDAEVERIKALRRQEVARTGPLYAEEADPIAGF